MCLDGMGSCREAAFPRSLNSRMELGRRVDEGALTTEGGDRSRLAAGGVGLGCSLLLRGGGSRSALVSHAVLQSRSPGGVVVWCLVDFLSASAGTRRRGPCQAARAVHKGKGANVESGERGHFFWWDGPVSQRRRPIFLLEPVLQAFNATKTKLGLQDHAGQDGERGNRPEQAGGPVKLDIADAVRRWRAPLHLF